MVFRSPELYETSAFVNRYRKARIHFCDWIVVACAGDARSLWPLDYLYKYLLSEYRILPSKHLISSVEEMGKREIAAG
jgi:hypothetical protein